ncbi:response regulator [Azospirillum sp. SYSU D00513]|uniref:response regulator n=1 Tax=Azospirillum sp. SYSU D00513 TaxID=2812561 RepID=UPI0020002AD6|nr:response regulator [Azospirillum sp. SYSU D00513]
MMTLDERRADQLVPAIEGLGVLLVEDESFTRKLIARMLGDLKVRAVFEASDGVMALDRLARNAPDIDVIICDLEMPRMGGLDLLHALRTATGNAHADCPVIVLTAHSEADTVKRAIAYGISGYLVKPVSKQDLVKRLTFAMQKIR